MARTALIPEWNYWFKFSCKFLLVEAKAFSLKTLQGTRAFTRFSSSTFNTIIHFYVVSIN